MDAMAGHQLLTFMDTFLGYNQICIASKDKDKISFITDHGLFCYKMMSFSLKNTRATYRWLVNKIFKDRIDHNMDVYVDNILVKSYASKSHVDELEETFTILCKY